MRGTIWQIVRRAIAYDELVATVSIVVPVSVQTLVLLVARAAGYRFVRSDSVVAAATPPN